jgi:hypothetical protein
MQGQGVEDRYSSPPKSALAHSSQIDYQIDDSSIICKSARIINKEDAEDNIFNNPF